MSVETYQTFTRAAWVANRLRKQGRTVYIHRLSTFVFKLEVL